MIKSWPTRSSGDRLESWMAAAAADVSGVPDAKAEVNRGDGNTTSKRVVSRINLRAKDFRNENSEKRYVSNLIL